MNGPSFGGIDVVCQRFLVFKEGDSIGFPPGAVLGKSDMWSAGVVIYVLLASD